MRIISDFVRSIRDSLDNSNKHNAKLGFQTHIQKDDHSGASS